MMPREKLRGQADQFPLFSFVHGIEGSAELPGPTRLNLHEYQCWSVFGDQIQFTHRRAQISRDDPVASADQKSLRRRFSFLPKASSGVKDSH